MVKYLFCFLIYKNKTNIMNFIKIIKRSIFGRGGKESSTRISAYVILLLILLFSLTLIVLEVLGEVISNEIIIIFASLLTHHLTLLGINKNHEAKIAKLENGKDNSGSQKPAITTPNQTTVEISDDTIIEDTNQPEINDEDIG